MAVIVLVIVLVVVLAAVATFGGTAVSRRRRARRAPGATEPAGGERAAQPGPSVEAPAAEVSPAELPVEEGPAPVVEAGAPTEQVPAEAAVEPPGLGDRMGKARRLISGYLVAVRAKGRIDGETWDELEEALVRSDVGVSTTTELLEDLRGRVRSGEIRSPEALLEALKGDLRRMLEGDRELRFDPGATNVWLFVGVNGVGKTTTIGKVATAQAKLERRVVMAAGDTFRAAAAEQLSSWCERVGAELVRGAEGGDPSSVVFDAVQRASARRADLVLADTAGRLHTKVNLMDELKKLRRVADRPPGQVTEVLLVLDATTGQNGLAQARQFTEAVGVSGVVLTKLDGTAKGGIVVAIGKELGIPVKLVGVGEAAGDLIELDPEEFVEALLG